LAASFIFLHERNVAYSNRSPNLYEPIRVTMRVGLASTNVSSREKQLRIDTAWKPLPLLEILFEKSAAGD
jgi:hypothetical protein